MIEIRRKNKVIQDKVAEQIQILQQKLEEYKLEHKAQEESLEDEIVAKEDVISNVKESLEIRMKAVELEIQDFSDSKLSEEERFASRLSIVSTLSQYCRDNHCHNIVLTIL